MSALRFGAVVVWSAPSVRVLRVVELMARRKPDIGQMSKALPRAALVARDAFRRQRACAGAPGAFWMRPIHYAEMVGALRGAGFDVARGVVLDGIPVKPYAS